MNTIQKWTEEPCPSWVSDGHSKQQIQIGLMDHFKLIRDNPSATRDFLEKLDPQNPIWGTAYLNGEEDYYRVLCPEPLYVIGDVIMILRMKNVTNYIFSDAHLEKIIELNKDYVKLVDRLRKEYYHCKRNEQ